METKELESLKMWFTNYVQEFDSDDKDISKNLALKLEHTKRVCKEIVGLGKELQLNEGQLCLAEAMALFHDVGRFEQYTKYRTYLDMKSENHAELGVKVLNKNQVLKNMQAEERSLIEKAVSYHNRKELPVDETEQCLFYTKLLRDADKLDIWKVVTDYYQNKTGEENGAIVFELPDTNDFSDDACKNLISGKLVDVNQIRCVNDFRLLQISWIYDINFIPTFHRIRERKYLEIIREFLIESKRIDHVLEIALDYIDGRLKNDKGF
ncbi:HD domain-containing protein [candidate division KSB1 bacterium]|nr:HD domain-containing protein [candidate division KSB1 bacterium]MBL7093991.1 HD domain-containing protein [candidate division KSB1 bacterium]